MNEIELKGTSLATFEEFINAWAAQFHLDPMDVAALILVESDGNPNAVNEKSRATGLCQVMPLEAGGVFEGRPTIEQLKDPNTNIGWGCMILRAGMRKHGDDVRLALYEYSGGKYWTSEELFDRVYWKRFNDKKEQLIREGAKSRA
jgi:soluble lytic murein transglycosylase-like protein